MGATKKFRGGLAPYATPIYAYVEAYVEVTVPANKTISKIKRWSLKFVVVFKTYNYTYKKIIINLSFSMFFNI